MVTAVSLERNSKVRISDMTADTSSLSSSANGVRDLWVSRDGAWVNEGPYAFVWRDVQSVGARCRALATAFGERSAAKPNALSNLRRSSEWAGDRFNGAF